MKFTVLGSGSCELDVRRSSPAHLVEAGDTALLLDAGQGALRRLMEYGLDPAALDGVLLSHHHLDHMADILPLFFALNYDSRMHELGSITLAGHTGVKEVLDGLENVFGGWVRPDAQNLAYEFLEPGDELAIGDVQIKTARATHLPTSLAWRLEQGGRSLVYLGDSEPNRAVTELARGADLLVTDCAATDENPKPGHIGPTQSGEIAREAGVKKLLLCHLYREMDPEDICKRAGRVFSGEVIAARDLLTVEL